MTATTELFTVKLSFDGQLRRFPIDGTSFVALYDQVLSLLGLEKNSELVLKYTDDQGDLITMSSDMELKSALVKGQILRVVATLKGKDVDVPVVPADLGEEAKAGWGGCLGDKKERKLYKKMWKHGGLHHGSFGPHRGPFGPPHGPHHGAFGGPFGFGPHRGPFGGPFGHHGHHARGPFGHPHGPHAHGPHGRGPFGHPHGPEKFLGCAKEKGMWKKEKGCKKAEKFALYAPLVDAVLANEHLQHVKRHKVFRKLRKFDGDKEKVIAVLTEKVFRKADKLGAQVAKEGEHVQKGVELMAL